MPVRQLPARARQVLRAATLVMLVAARDGASLHAAQAPALDSRRVKAEFVISFLAFTGWPAVKLGLPGTPYVVAVLGDQEFAAIVADAAAMKEVTGRKVIVKAVEDPAEALDAHVTFLGGTQANRLQAVLRTLSRAGTLTVGDTEGYASAGVAINLYTFDKRVRIEVNSTAAARAGLHLSANLMRLARVVE
jgi:hypothetical protein